MCQEYDVNVVNRHWCFFLNIKFSYCYWFRQSTWSDITTIKLRQFLKSMLFVKEVNYSENYKIHVWIVRPRIREAIIDTSSIWFYKYLIASWGNMIRCSWKIACYVSFKFMEFFKSMSKIKYASFKSNIF